MTGITKRCVRTARSSVFLLTAICCVSSAAFAEDFKIALITSTTGAFEVYAKQAQIGLQLGLEYATQGTMKVNGRPIVVIQKDDQLKPDRARALIEESFQDDKADIAVGSTSSATTLAMMPVAEELKKPLVVDVAGADSITGDKWNRYVVRTGRTVGQEAVASASLLARKDTFVAVLAQDYVFGRESAQVFKSAATKAGATVVAEEFLPINTTDFTGVAQRVFDALKDRPGKKILWVNWVGTSPIAKINAMDPARYGIELATTAAPLQGMAAYKGIPNLMGVTPYYYEVIKNIENEWLVAEHKKRFNSPPDVGTAFAFDAALAIVNAVIKSGGSDSEKLVAAFEGMSFEGSTGQLTIRKENHQALHDFYGVIYTTVPGVEWAVPKLIKAFGGDELNSVLNSMAKSK
ncbi:substrate-binding domain-containing protein [Bradyrhizobium sp. sBnM-33]|uniref:substrate-binding domain-containing protein n=1 Tax=Bradyrhizobium sp. sBnM-33 TaxID=2831780 RepID=UPI001BCE33E7|nr:substrate-binding domain-containing protein [Bradyrhizobium sp. sBnM-33]WOH52540.1 substrate-binding domain-containing protein [Bradyrhizobium sp. sBnM-33]